MYVFVLILVESVLRSIYYNRCIFDILIHLVHHRSLSILLSSWEHLVNVVINKFW